MADDADVLHVGFAQVLLQPPVSEDVVEDGLDVLGAFAGAPLVVAPEVDHPPFRVAIDHPGHLSQRLLFERGVRTGGGGRDVELGAGAAGSVFVQRELLGEGVDNGPVDVLEEGLHDGGRRDARRAPGRRRRRCGHLVVVGKHFGGGFRWQRAFIFGDAVQVGAAGGRGEQVRVLCRSVAARVGLR